MLTLLKCALLLSSGLAVHITLSSPTPPSEERNTQYRLESWVHRLANTLKAIVLTEIMADTFVTLLSIHTPTKRTRVEYQILKGICPDTRDIFPRLQPSVTFVFGAIILVLSGLIRRACYASLGKMFTFEVTIQPGHKLIKTGPYSFVRHPSYLSGVSACLSTSAVMLSRGAFVRECILSRTLQRLNGCMALSGHAYFALWGCTKMFSNTTLLEVLTVLLLVIWGICIAVLLRIVAYRLTWEEELLQKKFKREWTDYTKVVRWRIFPGLL